jgi:hypothetical protein
MLEASWYYLFRSPALYPHHRRWDTPLSIDRSVPQMRGIAGCPVRNPVEDGVDRDAVCGLGHGDSDDRVTFSDCLACLHDREVTS